MCISKFQRWVQGKGRDLGLGDELEQVSQDTEAPWEKLKGPCSHRR